MSYRSASALQLQSATTDGEHKTSNAHPSRLSVHMTCMISPYGPKVDHTCSESFSFSVRRVFALLCSEPFRNAHAVRNFFRKKQLTQGDMNVLSTLIRWDIPLIRLWLFLAWCWHGFGLVLDGVGTSVVLVLARFCCGLVFVLNRVWHDVAMVLASCWLDFAVGIMVAWLWHSSNW